MNCSTPRALNGIMFVVWDGNLPPGDDRKLHSGLFTRCTKKKAAGSQGIVADEFFPADAAKRKDVKRNYRAHC